MAAILSAPQQALAQLSIGHYGVQPGLESNYLRYQLSGQDLSKMRVIPGCSVGFGAACNKSGAVLQQLVESNNGPSYNDLVIRAAGGQQNFQNFASFYGNNPNLEKIPYTSFWQNDSPYIMDGYRYTLGQTVSRTPQAGLGQVTKNFYWSPEGSGNSLDPRSGLLNLKYSYGRLLLEEVAKIPNWKQQIQSQDLPPEVKQYYVSKVSQGLRALNSGNEEQLEGKLLDVLSAPYTPEASPFNRPNAGIPQEFDQIVGQGLPGDVVVGGLPILPEGDVISQEIAPIPEGDVVTRGGGGGFPYWALAGIPLILLPFLFGGGDDNSSKTVAVTPPSTGETPPPTTGETPPPTTGETPPPTTGETPPPVSPPPVSPPPVSPPPVSPPPVSPPPVSPPPVSPPPVSPPPTQRIPESSTLTPLLLLTMIMSILSYRKWLKPGVRM